MDEVELPLVEPGTEIEGALDVMVGAGKSGLVTPRDDGHVVFTIDELIEELRERGNKPLAELIPASRTAGLENLAAAPDAPRAPMSAGELQAEIDRVMTEKDADFVVTSQAGATGAASMIVAIRAVQLAGAMAATPVLCACPDGHPYTPDQAAARNGQCGKHDPAKPITCD
jgi:hypothetical protein